MKSIYEYSDYRLFLREFLNERTSSGDQLTYEEIGHKVGFTSKGFMTQILQGKSKLPAKKIKKFALALGLKKKEQRYFELLVLFNEAKRLRKKNELFQELTSQFKTRIKHIGQEKYDFYSAWYFSAIRSLLAYYPFNGDYVKLARQLNPAITPAQAKKAISILEQLELIEKKPDGSYHLTERLISTGDTIDSLAVTNFQQSTMDLAKEALERFPKKERHSSTLTLGLSETGYNAVVEKLGALRIELMNIARYDHQIDRVIQINLHAFPFSRKSKRAQ